MTEIEVLRRVEGLARDVKMNTHTVLAERSAKCGNCGHTSAPRGLQIEVRAQLMKNLRELESAFVELDLVRAGARPAS